MLRQYIRRKQNLINFVKVFEHYCFSQEIAIIKLYKNVSSKKNNKFIST